MTSYQVRNHQQESPFDDPHQKTRETTQVVREASRRTATTMESSVNKDEDYSDPRTVARDVVHTLIDEAVRVSQHGPEGAEHDPLASPELIVRGYAGDNADDGSQSSLTLGLSPAEEQHNAESLARTQWVEPVPEKDAKFSIEDVKRMVLESIPQDVRDMIPPESWRLVFNEASDSVLSEEIISLQMMSTEEDFNDLVSFVSVYVQREARGRMNSDASEITKPNAADYDETTTRSQVDTLETIDRSETNEGEEGDAEEDTIDSAAESRESRHASIASASNSAGPPLSRQVSAASADRRSHTGASRSVDIRSGASVPEDPREMAAPQTVPRQFSKTANKRQISFDRVDIRYYERILTDNPAVTSGPPIGIGWKYRIMKSAMTIDAWEHRQTPNRRVFTELVLPKHERTSILYDIGYSQREVAFAVREILKIKNKRKQTYNNLRFQNMEEMIEKTGRRFRNALTLGMVSRKEKKLLTPYTNKRNHRPAQID